MAKRKFSEDVVEGARRNILEGVGYGNPPKHTRFQKGTSGNPAGRPRNDKSAPMEPGMRAAILAESRRIVGVQEKNGQEISARDAVLRAQIKSAVKGSAYAQEHYLKRVARAEIEDAEEIKRENAEAEAYRAECFAQIEAARKAGLPEPEFLPHPADIIIKAGKRYEFVGPSTQAELEAAKRCCAMRDIFMMQHVLEGEQDSIDTISLNFLTALSIDKCLPKRMQLDDMDIIMSPYRRIPSRKLRALIRESCQELGWPVGRDDVAGLPCVDRNRLLAAILGGRKVP